MRERKKESKRERVLCGSILLAGTSYQNPITWTCFLYKTQRASKTIFHKMCSVICKARKCVTYLIRTSKTEFFYFTNSLQFSPKIRQSVYFPTVTKSDSGCTVIHLRCFLRILNLQANGPRNTPLCLNLNLESVVGCMKSK